MSVFTTDACVVIKWFVPEVHTESAVEWLEGGHSFLVPDLLYSELGNVIWKKVRKNEISEKIAKEIIQSLLRMPLELVPSKPLLSTAFDIAYALDRAVYDCIYLAAACHRNAPLITADQKFYKAIQSSNFKENILWVEDTI